MKKNLNFILRFDKSIFLAVLIALAYLRPEILYRIPTIGVLYNIYRAVVIGLIIGNFLIKKTVPIFVIFWTLFEGWIVLISIFRNADVSSAIIQAVTIISIAMLFELYTKKMIKLYKGLYFVLAVFIYINLICLILYPEGMYSTGIGSETTANWFLGFKNKHIIYYLPATGITFILGKYEGFNIGKIVLLVIIVASAIYVNSSTSLICLVIMIAVGFLSTIKKIYKIFNMFTYFGISLVMFIIIPLLRLQYLFSYIIVAVLKKEMDLTYRTDLWDRAFSQIMQQPIVGWGEQSIEFKHQLYQSTSIVTAHNQILEYLYVGGIILLLFYIVINIKLGKKVWEIRGNEIVQIVAGMYFALQIALIAEVYNDASMYMIYFMVWHIGNLCSTSDNLNIARNRR